MTNSHIILKKELIIMGFHKISNIIIKQNKKIEKIFAVIFIICILCMPFVGVNYDLSKYLPDYAPSKQGIDIMEDEFGYPGTARIMIEDVSIYEAKLYKDMINNVDGVDMVMWLDTAVDVYQSNTFINYDDINDYFKNNCAVMDVTFDEGDSSKKTHESIDKIEKIIGEKGYLTGSAVQNKSLSETLTREIAIAMILGVIMIAIILCLTTTSWIEPVLFLLVMGIAIVINMGTNIFLGTISFLTFSVAAILQLAIAMDYSIFLLHSFTHEKEKGISQEEALSKAIQKSVVSILSSGATTIVGFIVLVLMDFSIGHDMGIVLAKGIIISLLTVLILMPALILRFSAKIDKTAHRSFMPNFKMLGKAIFKIRYFTIALCIILVIPAYTAQSMSSFLYGNDALGSSPGTKLYDDEQKINKMFGKSNLIIAFVPNTSNVTEKQMSDELDDLYYTKSVMGLASALPDGVPEKIIPKSITKQLHTKNYARILIYIRSSNESDFAFECSEEITNIVKKYYPNNSYIVGVTPSTIDIKEIITKDYNFVNILSLIGVAIILVITFKSPAIPIVVIIPIEAAIFINMAIPYLTDEKMIYMGYIIVSCLQLGATIDYSILITNNYISARKKLEKKEAAIDAISAGALSVLTSGSILTIVGYGLFFTSSVSAIASIGRLVGRGALFSTILVLGLLPVLLSIFDRLIIKKERKHKKFLIRKESLSK